MSNHLVEGCKDGSPNSSTSLHLPQSFWMSRWTQAPSNQGSIVAPHSQTFSREEGLGLRTNLISSDIPRSYGNIRNNTKAETAGLDMGSLTIRGPNGGKERSDYPFCFLRDSRNLECTLSNTPVGSSCSYGANSSSTLKNNPSSALIFSKNDFTRQNQGNSHVRPPLFSKTTTTHHVLFSSQTGVAHESTQNRGVKIQPLWSSTDSERSLDISAETDPMDVVTLPSKNNFSGMIFPPIPKSTMMTDNPWEDKVKGKLPVIETLSTDSMEGLVPSPSRTQSLDAEHLHSFTEQLSELKTFPHMDEDESDFQELDYSRSVKRLKLSLSGVEESSSHEKTHTFLNMIIENSKEIPETPLTDKHQSEEPSIPSQNDESSLRTNKNRIFESSWIQRWCQDRSIEKNRHLIESVVICEPNSTTLALEELDKKQFPSIAAVAMMGKSVDGFHGCKYTKRGPLVVWNSEEY